MNKLLCFTLLNSKFVNAGKRLLFKPNSIEIVLVGLIYLFFALLLYLKKSISYEPVLILLVLPFVLYGSYNVIIPLFYHAEYDVDRKLFTVGTFFGKKTFSYDEIVKIVLDRIAEFYYLYFELRDGRKVYFGFFRGMKSELKAYNVLNRFKKLGFTVEDATSHIPDYKPKVRDKVSRTGNRVTVEIGLRDLPKENFLFATLFLAFVLLVAVSIPADAPEGLRVLFMFFPIFIVVFMFISSGGFWKRWEVVDEGMRFKIFKKSFLGIVKKTRYIDKDSIIWTVVREYVYRRTGQTAEHSKGFLFKVVTPKQVERLGAFLSLRDVKILRDFFSSNSKS